ncbi:MAG: branched-chain amino acid ABC transporter permease [Chloroflexota bacterium]|nr:branched-chain amino acid ABC transporter permease [Chloroflexota bacterium]
MYYLGMVTLGFGEIIRLLALNLTDITRGPMGLPGVPRISVFGISFQSIIPHFYLILFFILLTFYFIKRLIFSRFGRACRAVRDDEKAAEAMGIKSYKIKVISFCISAGLAGLMGAFYASWITFFSPDSFQFNDSIMMSAMITFGGIGSLYGPIFGAISIGSLPEILRPFTSGVGVASLRLAGVGLIMVLMLIIKPEGLFGDSITERYLSLRWLKDWLRKKKNKKIHNFKERQ